MVLERLRGWLVGLLGRDGADADRADADRVEGSGEVILDPAYNGRYTAERSLQRMQRYAEAVEERQDESDRVADRR